MTPLSSWLVYIRLRREDGARIYAIEVYLSLAISLALVLVWAYLGMPNSFAKDGLLDGLASLSAISAGFFVASLVAIATFFRENSSLDDVIESGPVILNFGTEDQERFTRRQYVCSIFGFLVGMSFFLAISATLFRPFAPTIAALISSTSSTAFGISVEWKNLVEFFTVLMWLMLFVWQIILTLRGLYYLMDRIYDVRPTLGKPKKTEESKAADIPRIR